MVYNYTKPRGPIAAAYSSPGPCYALPGLVGYNEHDPRSVHARGPAHVLAGRSGTDRSSVGPGPASYFPDVKLSRTGRDGTPHYSMSSRHFSGCRSGTPGPGSYSPERSGPSARKGSAPAYSFGGRHRRRMDEDLPAPNQYNVPSQLCNGVESSKRRSPAYSLSGRCSSGSFYLDMQRTPGPGTYGVTDVGKYKYQPPVYSLTSRNVPPSDATRKPGPGAHSPERVWMHKRYSPSYSFGIRHSPYTAPLIVKVDDY